MENQANSKNIILNYGLLLGGTSILTSLIIYATGNHLEPHWSVSIISIIILIAFIVLGIKKFRESNQGYISWGQAVKIGVGIAIIAALIGAIYNYIFMNFIEPDFMNQLMLKQEQALIDMGGSEEQIEAQLEMSKKFQSPGIMAAMSIVGAAVLGFIVSAIAGAVMKKTEEDQY